MNTLLSEDQVALEEFCTKLLQNEWPLQTAIKVLARDGARHSPSFWKTIAGAGWLGLPFAAEYGGADGDLADLGVIYRVCGEHVVPASYYNCMFAGLLVNALGTPAQKDTLLAPMISGDLLLTAAYAEPQAAEQTRLFKTTASRIGDEWVLDGVKAFVPDLASADVVLILARLRAISDHTGWGLFAVRKGRLGLDSVRQTDAFGATPLYEVKLDGLKLPLDALLGGAAAAGTTLSVFEETVQTATALQCMEMAGGIAGTLKLTTAYLKEREQFGRPIGANQAVQHLLANIAINLDGVRVAALKALYLAVNKRPEAAQAVSLAKVVLGEAYVNATITCGQLWGAMGYSRETGLYLWAERAKVTDAWYGTRASHLKRYAKQLELVA